MTIPPLPGVGSAQQAVRQPLLTAPVLTGVPPTVADTVRPDTGRTRGPEAQAPARPDAPISLAGRLEHGDTVPETTDLAMALESATRAMQKGRPDLVLSDLDRVWSDSLASDSPWYLRGAALQLLGRTSDSEQVLRNAVERLPRSAAILYLLGVHTSNRAHLDAAKIASDHAVALHPNEPLLWLQRAALAFRSGQTETAAALTAHAETLEPAFPVPQWLETLIALTEREAPAAGQRATPVIQRAVGRLTPASLPALDALALAVNAGNQKALVASTSRDGSAGPEFPVPPPASAPTASHLLETAVRYGLTLLDSPTESARSATHHPGAIDERAAADAAARFASAPVVAPSRGIGPSWEALVLATCAVIIAFVPVARVPALIVTGVTIVLMASRRPR